MELKSSAFNNNERIPTRYAKEGENVSPPLAWTIPAGCKGFALICEDPDAPKDGDHPFVHWLIYNISPGVMFLPENIPQETQIRLPIPAKQGVNSFGRAGYSGPLPPVDNGIHHYVFTLYALNVGLDLDGGMDRRGLLQALKTHTLSTAQLVGTYERRSQRRTKKTEESTLFH